MIWFKIHHDPRGIITEAAEVPGGVLVRCISQIVNPLGHHPASEGVALAFVPGVHITFDKRVVGQTIVSLSPLPRL